MPEGVLEYYSLSKTYYVLPGTQSWVYIWGSSVPGKPRKIDFKIFSGIFFTPINKMDLLRDALCGWWKMMVFPMKTEKIFFDVFTYYGTTFQRYLGYNYIHGQLQESAYTSHNMRTRFYYYFLSFVNTFCQSLMIGSIIVAWPSLNIHIPNIQYLQLLC